MAVSRSDDVQRAVMACGDDGIWDLSLGAILLVIGLVELLAWDAMWAAAILLFVPLTLWAKRVMTAPRMRDHETRRAPPGSIAAAIWILATVTLFMMLALAGLVALQLNGGLPEWPAALLTIILPIVLALFGVIIMVTVGTVVDAAGRYFLYAAVLAAGFLSLIWTSTPAWATFVVPGMLMVIMGATCLTRFLVTRQKLPQEARMRFRF